MGSTFLKFRKKRTCSSHTSFWMNPDVMQYIRTASKATRISQGQLIQIIIDQYRLNRKVKQGNATDDDRERLEMLEYFNRIIPM